LVSLSFSNEIETKSPRILQISVWLLQAHRLRRTWWLLVHSKVTLIRRFWLDEISHYLYMAYDIPTRFHKVWSRHLREMYKLLTEERKKKNNKNNNKKRSKHNMSPKLLLVHSKVTLIRRFWLDEISHYLYVHWSNRNRIHVILFIDFVRKQKWKTRIDLNKRL
jgi:hypothetical protein